MLYRELCDAAQEWVEMLQRDGVALPRTRNPADYSGKFVVRVEPALHQRLALKAMAAGESLNQLFAKTLTKA